jgi:hypothetical protein
MRRIVAVLGFCFLTATGPARAQPANDDCADATVIGALPFSDAVDTTAATTEAGDPAFECDGVDRGQAARSVWYRYTSPDGGSLEIDTFASDYDTLLAAWRGTCGALTRLAACNDTDHDVSYSGDQSRIIVTLAAGETIWIEAASAGPAGGNLVVAAKASAVFQVTDEDVYTGEVPDVAAASDGTFLVVWEEDDERIMGRRYCDSGVPLGAPVLVSEPSGDARAPQVARRGGDGFVVVWMDFDEIHGRRLNAVGAPVGTEFEVSADSPSYYNLDVAADAAGNFIVAWEANDDGDEEAVVARRFDTANVPLGPQFVVNTYTTGQQMNPSVAADPAGNVVIVWESRDSAFAGQDGSADGIFGQRLDAGGATVGGEFQVNTSTLFNQRYPVVATDPSGAFVVAWEDENQSCTDRCVIGRRYDASGAPESGEFVVSPSGTGPPSYYVSIDAGRSDSGDFVVAWANEGYSPFARRFAADGTPAGSTLQVGHVNDDYQREARMAVAGDGDFVVVWDWAPHGSHYKIMGRAETQSSSCPGPVRCAASPRGNCKQPTLAKGTLTLKDGTPETRDGLTWKWLRGTATSVNDIGDPLATDSYTLCVYGGAGVLLLEESVAPGGTCGTKPCWKDLNGRGFAYADKAGANGDVRKLVLRTGEAGRAKVVVSVQGAGVGMSSLPPALPVRAQLASTSGTCWDAAFEAGGVVRSTSAVFSARVVAGSPSGAFLGPPL